MSKKDNNLHHMLDRVILLFILCLCLLIHDGWIGLHDIVSTDGEGCIHLHALLQVVTEIWNHNVVTRKTLTRISK